MDRGPKNGKHRLRHVLDVGERLRVYSSSCVNAGRKRRDERHVVSRHRDKLLVAFAERLCPDRRLHRVDVLDELPRDGGIQRGFLDYFSQVVKQNGRFDADHICGRVR